MPFESPHPPISLPPNESIWSFFFNSSHSPLSTTSPSNSPSGYLDASTGASLSYAEVKQKATALSTALTRNHGFKANDTVILFSQNSIWYPVAMFAVLRAGGVVSGASPAYGTEEMSYALKTSGAKFVMTHPERLSVAVEACEAVGLGKENIFLLEGEAKGFLGVQELIEGVKEGEEVDEWMGVQEKGNKNVCAFLSFSSGTTGLPKAVSFIFLPLPRVLNFITPTPLLRRYGARFSLSKCANSSSLADRRRRPLRVGQAIGSPSVDTVLSCRSQLCISIAATRVHKPFCTREGQQSRENLILI